MPCVAHLMLVMLRLTPFVEHLMLVMVLIIFKICFFICSLRPSTVDVPVYRPPVYRFALFTGVFFSCHPVTPVYRWYAGIPGWFIFSCSLDTTQHITGTAVQQYSSTTAK